MKTQKPLSEMNVFGRWSDILIGTVILLVNLYRHLAIAVGCTSQLTRAPVGSAANPARFTALVACTKTLGPSLVPREEAVGPHPLLALQGLVIQFTSFRL